MLLYQNLGDRMYIEVDPVTNYKTLTEEPVNELSRNDNIQLRLEQLRQLAQTKYNREFLKVCAFYNKLFPSLQTMGCTNFSPYNVSAFTSLNQERADTGNGEALNYLKSIVDQVVARICSENYSIQLESTFPSIYFLVYRDEAERVLNTLADNEKFHNLFTTAFHNAAILGYHHNIIEPLYGVVESLADYAVAIFADEAMDNHVTSLLITNFAASPRYIEDYLILGKSKGYAVDGFDSALHLAQHTEVSHKFERYIDLRTAEMRVYVENQLCLVVPYRFDKILMTTLIWDTGITSMHTSSLFDMLYPIQREINRIDAKIQQLIRLYKGATPVLNRDADLASKSISNGSGEVLYINAPVSAGQMVSILNPTPLDTQLSAEITSRKGEMLALAGLSDMTIDMENIRSAAAVVALDQLHDQVYQAQLNRMAECIRDTLKLYVHYMALTMDVSPDVNNPLDIDGSGTVVDWAVIDQLLTEGYLNVHAVMNNDMTAPLQVARGQTSIDYMGMAIGRYVLAVVKGTCGYADLPSGLNRNDVNLQMALVYLKVIGHGLDIPDTVGQYLADAFLDAVADTPDLLQLSVDRRSYGV